MKHSLKFWLDFSFISCVDNCFMILQFIYFIFYIIYSHTHSDNQISPRKLCSLRSLGSWRKKKKKTSESGWSEILSRLLVQVLGPALRHASEKIECHHDTLEPCLWEVCLRLLPLTGFFRFLLFLSLLGSLCG